MMALANRTEARRSRQPALLVRVAFLATVACSGDDGTGTVPTGVAGMTAAGGPAGGAPGSTAGTGTTPTTAGRGAAGSGTAGTGTTPRPTGGTMATPTGGTAAAPMAGTPAPMGGTGGGATPPEPMAGTGGTAPQPVGMYEDPGPMPWVLVPEAEAAAKCKIDVGMLRAAGITHSFAIFRYGKLCYESGRDSATDVFSATKSLGGIVTATAAYLVKDVPKTGPGTGTFNDYDMASDWGLSGYRQGMQLAYLMSMTTGSTSLMWGGRRFSYDTVGSSGLNAMGNVVNRALGQSGQMSGVANIQAATRRMFEKLGMSTASWGGTGYGTGSRMTLHDMGKLFTLMIHGGVYNKERLIGEDWVYRMTHPAFEDANTSYGEFFWLNHRGNAAGIGGDIGSGSNTPDGDPCAPAAFWQRYPHKVSDAPDCQATVAGANCKQMHDTGIFSAQGLGGQFIIGHPGLDLVLAVKNWSSLNGPMGFWERVRPALVAADPMYKGDEDAFCKAYGSGDYAPDLKHTPVQPPDP
jgi:hypothetical protein